uniref:Uncharacterized protein n=1 Tax=Romanomermis culicivorax TaxID=13658 RepID=A0A915K430_ROMCU
MSDVQGTDFRVSSSHVIDYEELYSLGTAGQFLQQRPSSLGGAMWIVKDIISIASSAPSQWTVLLMAKYPVTVQANKGLEGRRGGHPTLLHNHCIVMCLMSMLYCLCARLSCALI